jgi:hypothetical protein
MCGVNDVFADVTASDLKPLQVSTPVRAQGNKSLPLPVNQSLILIHVRSTFVMAWQCYMYVWQYRYTRATYTALGRPQNAEEAQLHGWPVERTCTMIGHYHA